MTHNSTCLLCPSWIRLGYSGCMRHMGDALQSYLEGREIQARAQRFLEQQGDGPCDLPATDDPTD